jgi:hypothetical protein
LAGFLDQVYYAFNMSEAMSVELITWNTGHLFWLAMNAMRHPDPPFSSTKPDTTHPRGGVQRPFSPNGSSPPNMTIPAQQEIIAAKTGKPLQDVQSWQNTELVMDTDTVSAHDLMHGVHQLVIPPVAFFHQVSSDSGGPLHRLWLLVGIVWHLCTICGNLAPYACAVEQPHPRRTRCRSPCICTPSIPILHKTCRTAHRAAAVI